MLILIADRDSEISSLASVEIDRLGACFALNIAAPMKLAITTLLDGNLLSVVTSTAAHKIASIGTARMSITITSLRSIRARLVVEFAIIGRIVDVKQILSCWSRIASVSYLKLGTLV